MTAQFLTEGLEKEAASSVLVDWHIIAAWIETEGSIDSTIRHVKPSRSSYGRTPYFSLNILSVKDMDVVIGNTAQFFITFKARRQVERFTRFRHATAVELRSILQKK